MPTATLESLEQRLTAMEQKLAALEQEVQSANGQRKKSGWRSIVGTFKDSPEFEEAMRLGREWRENQFDEFDDENPPVADEQTQNRPPKGSLGLFRDEPEMVDEMMALIRAERDKSAQIRVYDIE